jgi:membrane protease YdiL (CAAX protease family)
MIKLSSHPLADFVRFLRHPTAERLSGEFKRSLTLLVLIVALDILLTSFTSPLTDWLIGLSGFSDEGVIQSEEMNLIFFISGVVLVPLIEEVSFRLGLAPNLGFLFLSLFLGSIQFAPSPFAGLFTEDALLVLSKSLFYLAIAGGITLFFWVRQRRGHPYTDFFYRYVGVYYYVGAVLFALPHLGNYANQPTWWLAPFLVLPQFIGGLSFGYLRIRLGFWYGVVAHMLINLLYHLGDLMNQLFGAQGGVVWLLVLIGFSLLVIVVPIFRRTVREAGSPSSIS